MPAEVRRATQSTSWRIDSQLPDNLQRNVGSRKEISGILPPALIGQERSRDLLGHAPGQGHLAHQTNYRSEVFSTD